MSTRPVNLITSPFSSRDDTTTAGQEVRKTGEHVSFTSGSTVFPGQPVTAPVRLAGLSAGKQPTRMRLALGNPRGSDENAMMLRAKNYAESGLRLPGRTEPEP